MALLYGRVWSCLGCLVSCIVQILLFFILTRVQLRGNLQHNLSAFITCDMSSQCARPESAANTARPDASRARLPRRPPRMVADDDPWSRLDAALPGEELAAATAAAAAMLRRVSKRDLVLQWTGWASRLTSLSQEPRVLLSAAGPALLSCALSLLQRADSVAVVDPVLKDECHRIETWCAQFVRNLTGGPSREEVDQLLTDVRADASRSCQALLRHEVHTLVCTLQALRSARGDAPDLAAQRDDEVVVRVSQLAVPLLPAPEAFPLVQELCMHARALHADYVAALVRRLEAGEPEAPPLGPRAIAALWLGRPAAELLEPALRQLLAAAHARPWLTALPPPPPPAWRHHPTRRGWRAPARPAAAAAAGRDAPGAAAEVEAEAGAKEEPEAEASEGVRRALPQLLPLAEACAARPALLHELLRRAPGEP